MNLRSVRSSADAVELLKLLGYEAAPLPYDVSALGLGGEGIRINSDRSPARGYGVVIAEVDEAPRSLRSVGRRLVEQFHDRPLALVGVRNGDSQWDRLIVVRPRLIEGGSGSVSVAKLTIDVERPSAHDAEIVGDLAWDGADASANHDRIDRALDVERVTKRFFEGLSGHYQRLETSVKEAGEQEASVRAGLERAGGADRVALRIVTQILFCYFLQRKGLLEGDRGWLSRQFRTNLVRGSYYQRILEPLFYEALARPRGERPPEWARDGIPFLNGGLFERHYGAVSLPLADEIFSTDEGLLGFLDGWTFTVSEEAADESEVAVDPEMLGKIFENLISEDELRREGTVYTPRPVVQFMCREALAPYLEREVGIDEGLARELLLDDERLWSVTDADGAEQALALARRIDDAVARIRILDPAVGSGAFLLGMMSELIRLRRISHQLIEGSEASPGELWHWKLHAVERCLFGVDINPTAIELCRLRLWLSLLVEEESGAVHPLPNLEYRTVCTDSLRDFVAGVEIQQTRAGALTLGLELDDPNKLIALRERYFEAFDPEEKTHLREELAAMEDRLVERILTRAAENAETASTATNRTVQEEGRAALDEQIPMLRSQFQSRDRVFPVFLPAFHAPDVVREGGWDVVIMNPPYVGHKEVAQRFDASYRGDLVRHYGRTYDLMIHFGFRAFELARTAGVVSMIFNDSIFTGNFAAAFRRTLLPASTAPIRIAAIARTRCFEGKAVNGGVIVAVEEQARERQVRYVENHGHRPEDLGAASVRAAADLSYVGESELWVRPEADYTRLPHRPLFRPSEEALTLLSAYERCAGWHEFSRFESEHGGSWHMLSFAPSITTWRTQASASGFYERLKPGLDFILLGLVIDGGQGLATADDRRFLGAIEGTPEAERALANRGRLEGLTLDHPEAARLYEATRESGANVDEALLVVSAKYRDRELKWPRTGLIRVAPQGAVRAGTELLEDEIREGIAGERHWLPFEKGDDSGPDGGTKWRRQNQIVIDWSPDSVALLRRRSTQRESYRRAFLTNQQLWGKGGVTYNGVASYLRARLLPPGSIFGHMSPILRPNVDWLTPAALLALLNAPVLDFAVRTFVGSRMHIEASDLRRLPIPVLTDEQARKLDDLGHRAVSAKTAADQGELPADPLAETETELDAYTRELYGISSDAELWVVR